MSLELVSNDLIEREDIEAEDMFAVDIDGYEGPLHLLLDLARKQKVDLLKVSMLELATQYLTFIEDARKKRIDLAADYLLMAAWLTFLKSRLLLPKPEKAANDEIDGEEMAARLAFRLSQHIAQGPVLFSEIMRIHRAYLKTAKSGGVEVIKILIKAPRDG